MVRRNPPRYFLWWILGIYFRQKNRDQNFGTCDIKSVFMFQAAASLQHGLHEKKTNLKRKRNWLAHLQLAGLLTGILLAGSPPAKKPKFRLTTSFVFIIKKWCTEPQDSLLMDLSASADHHPCADKSEMGTVWPEFQTTIIASDRQISLMSTLNQEQRECMLEFMYK